MSAKQNSIPLTVVACDEGQRAPLARSKASRLRAAVLIAIHVLAAIHIAHWLTTGKTLSPVEPSEAGYTFSRGLVNAGFVLLLLATLSTFVFGRFFCGWGCHLVALQDLCTWLLRRAGIRPKPFRSRLLIFVPLLAAIYMFIWPALYRHVVAPWQGVSVPPYQSHFYIEGFWDTFPGWTVGIMTFVVCGGLIVYILGNKGFCTYACPYGGIFGVADQFAPGKIRVTDACHQCGHCTATCTSNVRVHEEVRDYGMVVDPGCMKCMDCVSVCPNDALYFGFGRTAFQKPAPRAVRPARRYDYTWLEELSLVFTFVITFLALRSLYDKIPFLFALGLAGITAFLGMTLARLAYQANVRVHWAQLRRGGRLTKAGVGFAVGMLAWIGLVLHSLTVQVAEYEGNRRLDAGKDTYFASGSKPGSITEPARAALTNGRDWLQWAADWSLLPCARLQGRIGSAYNFLDDADNAQARFEFASRLAPRHDAVYRFELALLALGRPSPDASVAIAHLEHILRRSPDYPNAAAQLSKIYSQLGDHSRAEAVWTAALERRPHDIGLRTGHVQYFLFRQKIEAALAAAHRAVEECPRHVEAYTLLAGLLMERGQIDEADAQLVAALKVVGNNAHLHYQRGLIAGFREDYAKAREHLTAAVKAQPTFAPALIRLGQLARRAGDLPEARRRLLAALQVQPLDREAADTWAQVVVQAGDAEAAIEQTQAAAAKDRAVLFRLAYLYRAAGQTAEASRTMAIFEGREPQ